MTGATVLLRQARRHAGGGRRHVPYPPLTKDLHHEVELVVAKKSRGLNIPADKALDHV